MRKLILFWEIEDKEFLLRIEGLCVGWVVWKVDEWLEYLLCKK